MDDKVTWLNFTRDAGVYIKEDEYHGFYSDLGACFGQAGLLLNVNSAYVTDHPRTLFADDKAYPITCYMPYRSAFYNYGVFNDEDAAYRSVKQRLENFVAILNRRTDGVILCDVLPFSPHGPKTMTVMFYDAYAVNPSVFEKYSVMRVSGKACDLDMVDRHIYMQG